MIERHESAKLKEMARRQACVCTSRSSTIKRATQTDHMSAAMLLTTGFNVMSVLDLYLAVKLQIRDQHHIKACGQKSMAALIC
jgi:hypothetical protein